MRRRTALLVASVAVVLSATTGCSGSDCDELPALQAEREERRAAYLELVRRGADDEETSRADEELHAFERRVYELEQSCEARD